MSKRRITILPHGNISFHAIKDKSIRDALVKMNENMVALAKAIEGGVKWEE